MKHWNGNLKETWVAVYGTREQCHAVARAGLVRIVEGSRHAFMLVPASLARRWRMPPRRLHHARPTDTGRFVLFMTYVKYGMVFVRRQTIFSGYVRVLAIIQETIADGVNQRTFRARILREEDAPVWAWPSGNV